jgi:hypothetical protein
MSDQLIARPLPKLFGREMADNSAQRPPWGLYFFFFKIKNEYKCFKIREIGDDFY